MQHTTHPKTLPEQDPENS